MTTNELLQEITGTVRTNGSGAITGAALQKVLTDMAGAPQVVQLGGYQNDSSMDSAVKAEALRVPSGSTGGVYVNKIIHASSSGSGNQTNYTYFTLTSGGAVRLVRAYGSAKWMVNVYADGAWGGWANYEPGTAVMDVGQLARIEAFVERLRQYDVLHSGAVVVVTSIPGGDYLTRQFCFQAVNPGQGTARQVLFGKQTSGGEFDGVFVRDLVSINAPGGATAYDWERTMAQKFWLNGKKLEVGDYSSSGSDTGNVATVDLSSIAGDGGGGTDPDAFVGVASYGRGDTLLEMSFTKSGGGTSSTNLPMATGTLAGIMSGSDKAKIDKLPDDNLDRVITAIEVLQDNFSFPYIQSYTGDGENERTEFPKASATQGGMLSKEDYVRFDAAGLPEYNNGQNYKSWDALLTAFKSARPICPCIVTVVSEQVLMLQRGILSGGNGNLLFYCYDSLGVLRSISARFNSGLTTWANNWTVVDFRTQPLVAPYKDADSPRLSVDEWHTEFDDGLWATLTGKEVQYCTGVMKPGGELIITEGTPCMVLYGEDAGSKKHGFQVWPEGVISGYPASNVYYQTDGTPTDGLNRSTLFKKGSNISFINVTTGLLVSLTSSTLSEASTATMSD